MIPRRPRFAFWAGIGLAVGASIGSATPCVQGELGMPQTALDFRTYSTTQIGSSVIDRMLAGDFDADGNVDLLCHRASSSFFVAYLPAGFSDVVQSGGTGVIDVAVLPGPAGSPDSILAVDATGLTVWSAGSGLFPELSSANFELQVDDPLLVAVSEPDSGGTAYGWIVGDDGTEVTPFEWDVATADATALTTFYLSEPASQILCFSASGGAQVDLAVLSSSGASVVDDEGDVLFAVSGQDQDSLIARLPGASSAPDSLACILKQSGSSQRRLYVADVAGCDDFVGLGTYDYAACAVADLNSDGYPDLVVSRRGQKDLVAILNNGSTDHEEQRFSNQSPNYAILETGPQSSSGSGAILSVDLDLDGDEDALWALDRQMPNDLDLYLLLNENVCVLSVAPSITEFLDIVCDGACESGCFSALLELSVDAGSGFDHLRCLKLPPDADNESIVGAGIEFEDFSLVSQQWTFSTWISFPEVEDAHEEFRYAGFQLVQTSGGATLSAGPMRFYAIGRPLSEVVPEIVENGVWPIGSGSCSAHTAMESDLQHTCSDGSGNQDGGDVGGQNGSPPPRPPYGGGGS